MERPTLPAEFELISSLRGYGPACRYVIRSDGKTYDVGTMQGVDTELAKTPDELRGKLIEFIQEKLNQGE